MDMEMEISSSNLPIPKFAQAWGSSIRRPTTLPLSSTYHELVNPLAIFQLRETPTSEYIYVVPHSCTFCVSVKQACSRLPPCTRCSGNRTARPCHANDPGYQKLPPPKVVKGGKRKQLASLTTSLPRIPSISSSKRPGALQRTQSITSSLDPGPITKKPKLTPPTGFPGPSSWDADTKPPPQNASPGGVNTKTSTSTSTMPGKTRSTNDTSTPTSTVPVVDPKNTKTSTSTSTMPIWIPAGPGKTRSKNDTSTSASTAPVVDPPRTPRVWANSRTAMAAIFPELMKSVTGISWQRFDVPTLLLEHPSSEDVWKDDNTLEIARTWSYKCNREELEGGDPRDDSHERRVECRPVDHLHVNPSSFTPQPVVGMDHLLPMPPLRLRETLPCSGTPVSQLSTLTLAPFPSSSSQIQILSPCPILQSDTRFPSATLVQPLQLPVQKPPEIETLLQCLTCHTPLLVFVSQESGLLPQPLAPEYSHVSLGFFFVSNINAERVGEISNAPTHVMGSARWRVTLEWAPGGEEGLLEDTIVRSHPWWIDSTECPVENNTGSPRIPYRPRDLNDQYFSFLPLDLLADFKPSEFFPRGWYCRKCGMLNAQQFYRHQICQSSRCKRNLERGKVMSDDSALIGHVDPLHALRDPQHFLPIHDPSDVVPSSVGRTIDSWDDGMRTFTYEINEGIRVKHIFTGNQEVLQEDATRLLLAVQKDVILSRSDLHSPYFTWSKILGPEQTYTGDAQGKPDTPRPICDIQDVLLHYTQGYGDINYTNLNHILIQGWAAPGSKRGNLFKATDQVITILCLGAEVVMNLVPKRGFGEISIESTEDPMEAHVDSERVLNVSQPVDKGNGCSLRRVGSTINMLNSEAVCHQGDCDLGAVNQPEPASCDMREISGPSTSLASVIAGNNCKAIPRGKGPGGKMGEKALSELSLTLVHGDAAVLEGDEFECQIKRSGTTILLIGSLEAV